MEQVDGYASLNRRAVDNMSDSLDIFTSQPVDKSIKAGFDQEFFPVQQTNQTGPYTFQIPSVIGQYILPGLTRLSGKIQVRKVDATAGLADIVDTDLVAPINLMPACMWNKIEVFINGVQLSDLNTSTQHYKTYIETLLTYGHDATSTFLQTSWWSKDVAGAYDTVNAARKPLIAKSITNDFCIPLPSDVFAIGRALPEVCDVRVVLHRNSDDFLLLAAEKESGKYKIILTDLKIKIRRLVIHHDLLAEHRSLLERDATIYIPFTRSVIKTNTISSGSTFMSWPNIFNGLLPTQILVAMVDDTAFTGKIHKNPFNFQHFDCTRMNVIFNGNHMTWTPDLTAGKELVAKELRSLFDHIGILHSHQSNTITKADFLGGCFLRPIDISPDLCLSNHPHEKQKGSIDMEFTFSTATKATVTIMAFASFEDTILLNPKKNLVTKESSVISPPMK